MERAPVLFRCDGNSRLGWEPLYQGLTYAMALQRRRRQAHFLGQIEPFPLIAQLARAGNEYLSAEHPVGSPEDCNATLRAVRKLNVSAVVVIAPHVSTDYLRELGSTGALVAVIDSEALVSFPSKLVINPLLGPGLKAYDYERGTQLLLGARYALVRPMFRRQRPIRPADPASPFRAILACGDDDFAGESLSRAKELLSTSRIAKLTIFARSHHAQIDELQEFAAEHKDRCELLTEPSELSTRLPRAHFAVTSGDGWSLEMACVGVPQLIISQNMRHAANAKRMDEEGAAVYLGDTETVDAVMLRDAVNALLDDPLERIGMSRCARHLIDGRGPDRMVNALEVMLHPAMPADDLRIAA